MRSGPTLSEQAYARIEEMIVTLELEPGASFSEGDLCRKLDIGRTPVREALQRLATERLVAALPRRGMIVTDINIAEHMALLETRRVLDRLIAARSASRATVVQRQQLRRHAAAMVEAAAGHDLAAFMRIDRESDAILENACRNPFAVRACTPLHAHCRRFWYCYQENGDLGESARLHERVTESVADADEQTAADASDALVEYLVKFARTAIDRF